MPIIVKDFTWTQSNERVCINLPLKGTKSSNLDILSSTEYCKISYAPFFFECWFSGIVRDEECTAVVNNGIISLTFNKQDEKEWTDLFHSEHGNKELIKVIREEAISHVGERAKRLAKEKQDERTKNKKTALKSQMNLENEQRQLINNIKETERIQTTKEIEIFKQQKESKSLALITPKEQILSDREDCCSSDEEKQDKNIFDEPIVKVKIKEPEQEDLPAPRSTSRIQVKFTPRIFPTPQRESTNKQETEWLENQAEAQKFTELPEDLKDLNANETNLEWLKTKANDFYRQENYQAAVGAYTHALKFFPKVPALYSNRAACHFNLRNLIKCVEDSTRALELLTPPVSANATARLRSHVRRGSAFCELELYAEGLLDYEAALKIQPDNKDIIEDAENIRKLIVGTPPDFSC